MPAALNMKVSRKAFETAFDVASRATSHHSRTEMSRYVLLTARAGAVTLRGSIADFDATATVADCLAGDSADQVLLPAARTSAILREAPPAEVRITRGERSVCLEISGNRWELDTPNPADFPPARTLPKGSACTLRLKAHALHQLLTRTLFACDVDSGRYALGGVLLEATPGDGRLFAVATDSRRLSVAECVVAQEGAWPAGVVVPEPVCQAWMACAGSGEQWIDVSVSGAMIRAATEHGVEVVASLLQGTFPTWRSILPQNVDSQSRATTVAGPLHRAIRQSAVTSSEDSRAIQWQFERGQLTLAGSASSIGSSRVTIPVEYTGPRVALWLDPSYVSQALKCLEQTQSVALTFIDNEHIVMLVAGDDFRYLVMPVDRDGEAKQ